MIYICIFTNSMRLFHDEMMGIFSDKLFEISSYKADICLKNTKQCLLNPSEADRRFTYEINTK